MERKKEEKKYGGLRKTLVLQQLPTIKTEEWEKGKKHFLLLVWEAGRKRNEMLIAQGRPAWGEIAILNNICLSERNKTGYIKMSVKLSWLGRKIIKPANLEISNDILEVPLTSLFPFYVITDGKVEELTEEITTSVKT